MDVRLGTLRKLSLEESMLLTCVVGEGSWESLHCKEMKPVNPKGNQPWIFTGRADAQAEAPILWPPDVTNQDSILKSRDITLPTKVRLVKAMVFPVVMYECESWTIKQAESWRIDAFELWCWRRLLRVPWTARRSNQSILEEISPEYALEGLMLKLKLPILWPPDVKNWLTGKDPDAGKDWRQGEKFSAEDEMVGWHHWLNGHEFE